MATYTPTRAELDSLLRSTKDAVVPTDERARVSWEILGRKYASEDLLNFMDYCWWYPSATRPFCLGRHTRAITSRLTRAVQDYKRGISTYLIITCPFRHGKTDIVSVGFPPYFLGQCADVQPDVILTGYGANFIQKVGSKTKRVVADTRYQSIFPGVRLAPDANRVDSWRIYGSSGWVTVTGIGGEITGMGADLAILDDYCKSREVAESEAHRRQMWTHFSEGLMTRLASTHIVIIMATPWHIDDPIGRIKTFMAEDPNYTRFEIMKFSGQDDLYASEDNPEGWLFPELRPPEWYKMHLSRLSPYAKAAIFDCEPTMRGGNRFMMEFEDGSSTVTEHESEDDFPGCHYARGWDLACGERARSKDDPDFTVGALCGITYLPNGAEELWINDIEYGQWEAPMRQQKNVEVTKKDGPGVRVFVEVVGPFKDAWVLLSAALRGLAQVNKIHASKELEIRAEPLETIFSSGNVHILKDGTKRKDGSVVRWNKFFYKHFREYPNGGHDDAVAGVVTAYEGLKRTRPVSIDRAALGI